MLNGDGHVSKSDHTFSVNMQAKPSNSPVFAPVVFLHYALNRFSVSLVRQEAPGFCITFNIGAVRPLELCPTLYPSTSKSHCQYSSP